MNSDPQSAHADLSFSIHTFLDWSVPVRSTLVKLIHFYSSSLSTASNVHRLGLVVTGIPTVFVAIAVFFSVCCQGLKHLQSWSWGWEVAVLERCGGCLLLWSSVGGLGDSKQSGHRPRCAVAAGWGGDRGAAVFYVVRGVVQSQHRSQLSCNSGRFCQELRTRIQNCGHCLLSLNLAEDRASFDPAWEMPVKDLNCSPGMDSMTEVHGLGFGNYQIGKQLISGGDRNSIGKNGNGIQIEEMNTNSTLAGETAMKNGGEVEAVYNKGGASMKTSFADVVNGNYGHYAWVLVDVDLARFVPEKLLLEITVDCIEVDLYFESFPDFCTSCHSVGHHVAKCKSVIGKTPPKVGVQGIEKRIRL
ncbi:hypothetical protein FNV43_RR21598 [Rhamnella rubrinervis]|uniref:Zinc knuckle CX2CX4HX4C domain-containing protein n=1 Tax=Rhamnella rubrinervis TaxID=2594499 RepID=A0A8K0DSS2_9ROSA|nr:hypothetical protein FNV43_RR21598 [Rhamnella rubrinervis]